MTAKTKYGQIPKVELHNHFDCSLSYEFVSKYKNHLTRKEFQRRFQAPDKCRSLTHYLTFTNHHLELLQEELQIRGAIRDLEMQLVTDNVFYSEVRFAPYLHTRGKLGLTDVFEIISDELNILSTQSQVDINFIVSIMREDSSKMGETVVNSMIKNRWQRIVGIDLVSDETMYGIDNHIRSFDIANEAGINVTVHSGEGRGPKGIEEVINKLSPKRLGHGVRIIEDSNLLSRIKEQNIHLEICPTSNIVTNVYGKYEDHPINQLYKKDLSISINTDGRSTLNLTLNKEYEKLNANFGWSLDHFVKTNLLALDAAFTDDPNRKLLKTSFLNSIKRIKDGF